MAKRITDAEARQIMRDAGYRPLVPYFKSSAPWPSICLKCKKKVSPTFNNVNSKKVGCPYCSGNAVHIDDVMKVMKKAKLIPLEEFPGAKKPWKCECLSCKLEVSPTFSSVKRGGGCKFCARKIVGKLNQVDETAAIKFMKSIGLRPLVPYPGGAAPWKSECLTCKKVVSPRYSSTKNREGGGCKYCAGRAVDEVDAMAFMKFNKLKPLEPYKGNKHPWKSIHSPCGKVVSPRYNGLKKGQGPCKYCAEVAVDPVDAEKVFLENQLRPLEPYSGNNKKPWKSIHIPCGNEVSPSYNIIQRQESIGCHFCSDQFVDPDEAFQFFLSKDLQPLVPYPGSSKPWKSIHTVCGEVIQPRYGHIKSGRVGCIFCAGTIPITQERAYSFFRNNDLEPLEPFKDPNKPWRAIHTVCGREVTPRWASVQQGHGGCAFCSGNKVDLKEVEELLAKLELKALVPYPGGNTPWKCIHIPCGAEVSPRYNGLSQGQGGCLNCGKNVVTQKDALELLKKNNYKPLAEFPGGSKPWPVLHEVCGSRLEIFATYLRQGGKGCSTCSRTKPITAAQANKYFKSRGFKPLEPFKNAKTPMRALHLVCGREVTPTWGSLKSSGGCKYCSVSLVNLVAPAYFYLITNPELRAHKVGISGHGATMNRLERHKRLGWEVFAVKDLETGEKAYDLEDQILVWLRTELGLPKFLIAEQMPQGGHTETIDANEIDLAAIWDKVEQVWKFIK
jgi:recombinational DNA repair protein (RecF pathway)